MKLPPMPRRERVDRRQQHAGEAGERGADAEGQHEGPLDIDAHQPRGAAVLGHRADRLAGHRARQEQVQRRSSIGVDRDEDDEPRAG